jgi:hypothetical protein
LLQQFITALCQSRNSFSDQRTQRIRQFRSPLPSCRRTPIYACR